MRYTQGQRQNVPFSSTPKLKKGLWSPKEDEKLNNYMMKNIIAGCSWSYVAKQSGLQRCGNSCRLRWINYLRPGLKHTDISPQEEQLIVHLQSILGNRWSQIAANLPGRMDNEIKNYWNSYIKKKLNLKQYSMEPFSSSIETNGNNCTESNIPSQLGHTYNTNYSLSANAQDAYTLDAMSEGYLQSVYNIFHVLASKENQHSYVEDVLDLRMNSLSQVFTSTTMQTHDQTCNTAKLSSGDQLITSWTTLPPREAPGSTINAYVYTITYPALVDMGDSSKANILNAGHIIVNENWNEIMNDDSSFTASSAITAWSACHSHSNAADFTDVYPGDYTDHTVEDLASQLHDKTQQQSCLPNNSGVQFFTPAIMSADVDRYLNIQPQHLFECKDHVNLGCDEVNLRAKTYINIHKKKSYQIQVGDQLDFFTIPNEEAGAGECGTFDTKCEGEPGLVNMCAVEDHMYNIHSDTAASYHLDQFCLT